MVRLVVVAMLCCLVTSAVSAQTSPGEVPTAALGAEPLQLLPALSTANRQTYLRLRKDPWLAFGYEAIVPGAGSLYTGIRVHAIVAFSVSVLGAGVWTAGAIWERDDLWWAGAIGFGLGRTYGLVAAPLGAALLNAAFRRQLGIAYRF